MVVPIENSYEQATGMVRLKLEQSKSRPLATRSHHIQLGRTELSSRRSEPSSSKMRMGNPLGEWSHIALSGSRTLSTEPQSQRIHSTQNGRIKISCSVLEIRIKFKWKFGTRTLRVMIPLVGVPSIFRII